MREWIKRLESTYDNGMDVETRERLVGKLFEQREYREDLFVKATDERGVVSVFINEQDVGLRCGTLPDGGYVISILNGLQKDASREVPDWKPDFKFRSREAAERMLVLTYDAGSGPFDRALGVDREIYFPMPNEIDALHRFETTEDVGNVYLVTGVREASASRLTSQALENTYEAVTLAAGAEVVISASGTFAIADGQLREIAFEMPPHNALALRMGKWSGDGVAFPTSRVQERAVDDEFRERLNTLTRPSFERAPSDTPRVVAGGLFGHKQREISHEEDRMSMGG